MTDKPGCPCWIAVSAEGECITTSLITGLRSERDEWEVLLRQGCSIRGVPMDESRIAYGVKYTQVEPKEAGK